MATAIVAATTDSVTRLVYSGNGVWEATKVLPTLDARCLAVDPLNPQKLYAGGENAGLYTSDNGGISWQPVSNQPPKVRIFSIAVSWLERKGDMGAVYVGTEPSSIYKSEDGGRRWEELRSLQDIPSAPSWSFPPRPWTSHVRQIALSPHDPKLIVAGIELGGIMRSDDGGKTWRDHPNGAYKDCHALSMHPKQPGLIYEAGAGGVAVSKDGGLTWSPCDDGIERKYVFSMAVDYEDPELVYVGASVSAAHAHYRERDAQAAVYRRKAGCSWKAAINTLSPPLPHFPYGLATHPDEHGVVYVGFGDGSLAVSRDHGDHWEIQKINGDRPKEFMSIVAL